MRVFEDVQERIEVISKVVQDIEVELQEQWNEETWKVLLEK